MTTYNTVRDPLTTHQSAISSIYKSIKDGYRLAEAHTKHREYFFLQKQAERKQEKNIFSKSMLLIQEILTGYGLKPPNVLLTALTLLVVCAGIFYISTKDIISAVMLSVNSFITDGGQLAAPYNYIVLFETLCGILLFALFITVLANVWFAEK